MKIAAFLLLISLTVCLLPARSEEFKRSGSGLQFRTIRAGTGPIAKIGQTAVIHEVTRKQDGSLVADTYALNVTPQFEIGADQVIKGVDEGVVGMRVGEIRELIVPPSLSKRKGGYPPNLSPDDVLHYEVLLVRVIDRKPQTPNKAPEPTPTSVTPPAAQESRRP